MPARYPETQNGMPTHVESRPTRRPRSRSQVQDSVSDLESDRRRLVASSQVPTLRGYLHYCFLSHCLQVLSPPIWSIPRKATGTSVSVVAPTLTCESLDGGFAYDHTIQIIGFHLSLFYHMYTHLRSIR